MLCFAGYEFDPQRAELRGPDGETIRLRPKSFDMLRLFAANPGRVLVAGRGRPQDLSRNSFGSHMRS